ncbi:serine hydrolase domain-containing protein [Williamwhitmania taraxaci]|uniref:CubicO group peptidase, beta-lactamase class C family n=1 Tax=Williamwhitmania taraxaci TaxID=1640674 RepID=A0A1G6H294_9BACT|nr:serine hydrolase domain-containing protein [Williamwhitmania taraxaci]SDB88399.1 CubicO group peptidase, beta-lactamase class C family [Williamwhitmania taraxaci]
MKRKPTISILSITFFLAITATTSTLFGRTDSLFNYRLYGQPGIQQDSLLSLFKGTRGNTYGEINGMAIMVNGKLIGESYYGLYSSETPFPINSVTKSIISLACGVCVEQGRIKTTDLISKYLPEYDSIFAANPLKAKIRISDLLNQTTGLSWDEWFPNYTYSYNSLNRLKNTKSDWAKLALEQPMATAPGVRFNYNSASLELLKKIMEHVTKTPIDSFIYKNLFDTIGIKANSWAKYPINGTPSWGGMTMKVKDIAKLGQAILNSETGKSKILPKSWIDHIYTPKVNAGNEVFYSYLFWHKEIAGRQVIFAAGLGDQFLYIVPSLNLVFAIASSNYYTTFPIPGPELILQRIIQTIEQNPSN